ncbi:hypothetical protein [Candidatus Avelusimicrobium facis]|uniref:hypothetical protein n=1 Tax=Candidatus Avelusimicrobium facis TaxID=3416203 RepID=UPI003D0A8ED7
MQNLSKKKHCASVLKRVAHFYDDKTKINGKTTRQGGYKNIVIPEECCRESSADIYIKVAFYLFDLIRRRSPTKTLGDLNCFRRSAVYSAAIGALIKNKISFKNPPFV